MKRTHYLEIFIINIFFDFFFVFLSSGEFGRYQGFQFFLHILSAFAAGMHMLSLVTVGATPEHRCFIDGVDTNESIAPWNSTLILSRIPQAKGVLSSCSMYGVNNTILPCQSYVYDRTYYQSSRTIDWDFVCDKRWMISIAQTIYMLGTFTGAITLGGLADKVGRKAIFCWSAILQLVLGVGVAFVPSYIPFLIVRFLYGIFGSAGSYITGKDFDSLNNPLKNRHFFSKTKKNVIINTIFVIFLNFHFKCIGFVLTMELVGASKRTSCGVSFQAAFAGGIMLVAAWGAIIPDRKWLQVIYGLHSCVLIVHWWVMDESPRWLWAQVK